MIDKVMKNSAILVRRLMNRRKSDYLVEIENKKSEVKIKIQ